MLGNSISIYPINICISSFYQKYICLSKEIYLSIHLQIYGYIYIYIYTYVPTQRAKAFDPTPPFRFQPPCVCTFAYPLLWYVFNLHQDTKRDGLVKTPMRMAKALLFCTQVRLCSASGLRFGNTRLGGFGCGRISGPGQIGLSISLSPLLPRFLSYKPCPTFPVLLFFMTRATSKTYPTSLTLRSLRKTTHKWWSSRTFSYTPCVNITWCPFSAKYT